MLFCLFCFLVRISSAVCACLELLGTGGISGLFSLFFLCAYKVFADIEEARHRWSRVSVVVPELIKLQAVPEIPGCPKCRPGWIFGKPIHYE